MEEKTDYLKRVYNMAALRGLCNTKKEFAQLLGVSDKALSSAMNGSETYLTKSLLKKVELFVSANGLEAEPEDGDTSVLVSPTKRGAAPSGTSCRESMSTTARRSSRPSGERTTRWRSPAIR